MATDALNEPAGDPPDEKRRKALIAHASNAIHLHETIARETRALL